MVLIVHQVVQGLKSQTSLLECVATHLKVPISAVKSVNVVRRSIDARKRGRSQLLIRYSVTNLFPTYYLGYL